jgi:hypothetical protein
MWSILGYGSVRLSALLTHLSALVQFTLGQSSGFSGASPPYGVVNATEGVLANFHVCRATELPKF